MGRRSGLGRGLSALIPEGPTPDERIPVTEVAISKVAPNPEQPRLTIAEADMETLTASVREHGVIQPLLVSEQSTDGGETGYLLIAGERRLRAARAAGLTHVPVTIRQTTPQELLELALIENVQRLDLSPLEEALAYRRLIDQFALTQQGVADRIGRSRTAVANTLRLLDLTADERGSLGAGELTEGHARALLGIPNAAARWTAWQQAIKSGLNVRQTERMVRRWRSAEAAASQPSTGVDPQVDAIAESLRRSLSTKVTLRRTKRGSGSMTIHFYSDEELDGLLDRLSPEQS
ncbi:MAG: ParB/RepB/Spo0J family partition protein [Dehalococcoidia bacterium]|jgi:ParB family chromosome partitioning protein|nr:ParB/RepB/Spo0J family partition protein [Dehalococcoidia bacterium]